MGDTAYILHPEYCDLCKSQGLQVQAVYDGKTIHGPWAYMCEEHFGALGVGLGTGRGQRLIVGEKPDTKKSSPYEITEVDDEEDTDETLAHCVDDVTPHPAQTTETEEGGTSEHESAQSPTEQSLTDLPATERDIEKPVQKRKRLRASRRKKSIEQLMADSDMKRLEAEKTAKPEQGIPAEEAPEEEEVTHTLKMDWGNLFR